MRTKTLGKMRTAFLAGLLLLSIGLSAQTGTGSNQRSLNWQLDATVNKVRFYHAVGECDGQKTVFLKFENDNPYAVNVAWREKFNTQYEQGVEALKGRSELKISKGVTMAPGCAAGRLRKTVTTAAEVRPHYVAEIVAFRFDEISVTKAK